MFDTLYYEAYKDDREHMMDLARAGRQIDDLNTHE